MTELVDSDRTVRRVDYIGRVSVATAGAPRTDGIEAYETPTGLRLDGVINTCDCVYQYEDEDGNTWGELRLAADVLAPEVLAAWKLCPLTDDHPDVFVTPENWDSLAVGGLGSNVRAREDAKATLADIAVNSAPTISKIKDGKVGLSCGYRCTLVPEEGEYNGVPYRYRQTAYEPNHVSVVEDPRGEGCEFVIDGVRSLRSRPTQPKDSEKMKTQPKPKTDDKIMVGETEMEVAPEVAKLVADLQAKIEEQGAMLAKLQPAEPMADAEMMPECPPKVPMPAADSASKRAQHSDALEVELAMLRERNSQLEAAAKVNTGDALDTRVSARVALVSQAITVLGDKPNLDGMTNRQIKVEVVRAVTPETAATLDGKSEDAVDTAYSMALKMRAQSKDSSQELLALTRTGLVPTPAPVDLNGLFQDNLRSLRVASANMGGN